MELDWLKIFNERIFQVKLLLPDTKIKISQNLIKKSNNKDIINP